MIGIDFDKAKAEAFLECLRIGKPIPPQDAAGWTQRDMLALAGACFFAALTNGPALHPETASLHPERREAVEDSFDGDLHAAIGWYAQVTMMVADGEYDAEFEPRHQAIVTVREGRKQVQFTKGKRT